MARRNRAKCLWIRSVTRPDSGRPAGRNRHFPWLHVQKVAGDLISRYRTNSTNYFIMLTSRRHFLQSSSSLFLSGAISEEAFADAGKGGVPAGDEWNRGTVKHILPTVNHSQMLIKVSFEGALQSPPVLKVGSASISGKREDTNGENWSFHVDDLTPGKIYQLALLSAAGKRLCEPWPLSTFPAPTEPVKNFRLLIYSCAGGHELHAFLPTDVRNRLLKRGLSFRPDALVANGDHVYWDLLAPVGSTLLGGSPAAKAYAGTFERSRKVLGSTNETVLKKSAGPQIVPVYGTDFRSTPTFFLQDDHDYFDNDEATDEIVTFPPSFFMMQLARTTQSLYYPEFLPDRNRPLGLPWSSAPDKAPGVSESFGTLRFGNLAEILLYDVRRTQTMAGPSAVFLDPEVERWLSLRTTQADARHVVHVPSNPPGWTAGKWGEWYPDVLGADGALTIREPKPYWQTGWLKQHDRLMHAMAQQTHQIPLVISGDLHATALAQMHRTGQVDLSGNPVNVLLSGPLGCRPGPNGWPSGRRGTGAKPSLHLDLVEEVKPIEQHGFSVVDFSPDQIKIQMFKWDIKTQSVADIDSLQPYHVKALPART